MAAFETRGRAARAGAPRGARARLRLAAAVLLTWPLAGAANGNLSFEDAGVAGTPPGWTVSARDAAVTVDARFALHGSRSLRAELEHADAELRVTQRVAAAGLRRLGNRVRVSAAVGGADSPPRVSLRVRVEGDGALLYVDRGRGGGPRGAAEDPDAPWRRLTIEAPLAPNAETIELGASVSGPGRVWLDDFRIEAYDTAALPPPSPAAARYVERALRIMRTHSLRRAEIDWPELRAATLAQARGARTPPDTYLALQFALTGLGDRHSYFMPPERMRGLEREPASNARTGRPAVAPAHAALGERIGYVAVPGFAGGSQADQAAFAGDIQDRLEALDSPPRCGWIVDLRGNSGGNLWPMLAGVGPLLGNGEVGAALHPSGRREPIAYHDGKVSLDGYVQLRVRREPYTVAAPSAPLAVLVDGRTASSGEILALFLLGREPARSFGAPTRGVATGTQIFPLSDGAALILTVATTSDRHGRVADGPIEPDVRVSGPARRGPAEPDAARRAALDWIERVSGCR